VRHVDRKAVSSQKTGRFGHSLRAASGAMQSNHGGKGLSIACRQKAIQTDLFPTTFKSQLRLGDSIHGD
jgi:hypothetical protein